MCEDPAMVDLEPIPAPEYASAPEPAPAPHTVAVLLVAPVVGFDATIPSMVFRAANPEDGAPRYRVRMCAPTPGPVPTVEGYAIVADGGPDELAVADTVIVPGTREPLARGDGALPDPVRAALARIRPDARVVSICTGAFILAAAGRLDDRPATTHWSYAERFRALYPQVHLDDEVLFVDDGDVLTSAGLAAGIDLCLHLIRTDHGAAVANAAARHCVVPPWRDGGQAQFIERPVPEPEQASTAAARNWALAHLDRSIDVEELARRAHQSVRTFNRRFREETGQSPGAWLIQQRRVRARHLLESTDLPVDEVARQAGLGSGATLRYHLRESLGVSPVQYRRTFRGRSAS